MNWELIFVLTSWVVGIAVGTFVVVVIYCLFFYDDTPTGERVWRIRDRDLTTASPKVGKKSENPGTRVSS